MKLLDYSLLKSLFVELLKLETLVTLNKKFILKQHILKNTYFNLPKSL